MTMSTEPAHLYTFWISHFSEKARWSLRQEGIPFVEHPLLPGPHVAAIRKISRQQQVPVLVFAGEVIEGSRAILDAMPRLFGATRLQPWCGSSDLGARGEQARQIEQMADECFGRPIQTFGYDTLLRDRACLISLWNFRGPWWGSAYYAVAYPFIARFVRGFYCGDPALVAQSRDVLLAGMDKTDEILGRQDYLLGDGPTRTDIAVASLLCPLVRPSEHPMVWPQYPEPLEAFCMAQRGRPTWEFTLRMYRQHRNA